MCFQLNLTVRFSEVHYHADIYLWTIYSFKFEFSSLLLLLFWVKGWARLGGAEFVTVLQQTSKARNSNPEINSGYPKTRVLKHKRQLGPIFKKLLSLNLPSKY